MSCHVVVSILIVMPVQRHCKAVLLVRHSPYCESQSRPNSSGPWTPTRIAQVRSNRHGRLADPRPEEAAATIGYGAARFAGPALHQLQAQGHDGREAGKYSTLEKSSSKTFSEEKFNDEKFIVENFQRRQQFNVEMHQGQTIFTVRNFINCRRV